MNIEWHDAKNRSERYKQIKKKRYDELLEEINGSNPSVLSSNDFHHYAGELNDCNVRKEKYTANEVRRIMMDSYGCNSFDMLESFVGDETDDVIDFY